jgi:hypothetical protein
MGGQKTLQTEGCHHEISCRIKRRSHPPKRTQKSGQINWSMPWFKAAIQVHLGTTKTKSPFLGSRCFSRTNKGH